MGNFIKGMIFGLLVALIVAVISIPRMDEHTHRRIKRGCRNLCNRAEGMYDSMNYWMR